MEGTRKRTVLVRFKHNIHEVGAIVCRLWIRNNFICVRKLGVYSNKFMAQVKCSMNSKKIIMHVKTIFLVTRFDSDRPIILIDYLDQTNKLDIHSNKE